MSYNTPTPFEFEQYRRECREAVRIIIGCIRYRTIPLGDWARRVIRLNRNRHSQSIKRQRLNQRKFFEGYDRDNYKLSIRIP
jgi:hypothetical protein